MSLERVIFDNLVFNEQYGRRVIAFLSPDYFQDNNEKKIYEHIDSFVKKYNTFPSKEALYIELSNDSKVTEHQFKECKQIIDDLTPPTETNLDWIVDQTEKFCQEKAVYNAIMESIQILDDKTGKKSKGSIPELLSNALSVTFDSKVGHDFLEEADKRFEFYHKTDVRIPFDLDYFNTITGGGLSKKSLSIFMASTGAGKSLFMCHCAANNLVSGLNVLYITMEMAEEKIAERIDANLLNTPVNELTSMPKATYDKKINRLKEKTKGKLIVKEYPTACAGSANFRHLINELKIKKNFVPDIIYIDYLNICMSSRVKQGSNVNTYTYVKAIAEELRGLAVEFNVPIVSATQVNRSGYSSSDVDLENTSESFGLPATADLMLALISTEELEALNQIMVKQLKNRYSDPNRHKRFVVGIDRSRMKLYNVEQQAQEDIVEEPTQSYNKFNNKKLKSLFGGSDE